MRQKLFISLASVIVGGLLTLIGKPYIDEKIQERKIPVLVKEIYRPDVSGLSEELQRQVTILPVKYTLEHKVGGSAKNLTIFINSDSAITPSEIRFAKWEAYTCIQVDTNSIKIDIPTVRPGSVVTFELLAKINNTIQFQELVEVGKILSVASYKAQDKKSELLIKSGIVVIVLIWISFIVIVILVVLRVRIYWRDMETGIHKKDGNIREPLIKLIIIILLYNIIRSSLGPFGGILPLPFFSFSTFFYAFCLYLIITRYKLIEDVLIKILGRNNKEINTLDEQVKESEVGNDQKGTD